ncbi:MAG: Spy/CpxP family protein refolding chaperone [Xanthobacteraceae bacterium]
MRKVGAFLASAALATIVCASPPAAAFGLRIGPFHIGVPLYFPHFRFHHHPLYMRANRHDLAHPGSARGLTSALLYPTLALPVIFQNVFFPDAQSQSLWPFGYEHIFSTAFAKVPASEDQQLCRPSLDANEIVARIAKEVSPTADQMQLLQKLGGALGESSGYLAKACPTDIPAQPVARLQLMESQIEVLTMAVDVARQPLQDFEQSLSDEQKAKFETVAATAPDADRENRSDAIAPACGSSPVAIDSTIDQIDRSVQPTDAQRPALTDVRQAFGKADDDLEAHCPTTVPPTAVGRLDAIEARLDATWRSVLSIQVALANFEMKLDDAQKGRFDQMNFAAR